MLSVISFLLFLFLYPVQPFIHYFDSIVFIDFLCKHCSKLSLIEPSQSFMKIFHLLFWWHLSTYYDLSESAKTIFVTFLILRYSFHHFSRFHLILAYTVLTFVHTLLKKNIFVNFKLYPRVFLSKVLDPIFIQRFLSLLIRNIFTLLLLTHRLFIFILFLVLFYFTPFFFKEKIGLEKEKLIIFFMVKL